MHDREQIDKNTIRHGNIWGVSDEGLYTMALGVFDKNQCDMQTVLHNVMTTS